MSVRRRRFACFSILIFVKMNHYDSKFNAFRQFPFLPFFKFILNILEFDFFLSILTLIFPFFFCLKKKSKSILSSYLFFFFFFFHINSMGYVINVMYLIYEKYLLIKFEPYS